MIYPALWDHFVWTSATSNDRIYRANLKEPIATDLYSRTILHLVHKEREPFQASLMVRNRRRRKIESKLFTRDAKAVENSRVHYDEVAKSTSMEWRVAEIGAGPVFSKAPRPLSPPPSLLSLCGQSSLSCHWASQIRRPRSFSELLKCIIAVAYLVRTLPIMPFDIFHHQQPW